MTMTRLREIAMSILIVEDSKLLDVLWRIQQKLIACRQNRLLKHIREMPEFKLRSWWKKVRKAEKVGKTSTNNNPVQEYSPFPSRRKKPSLSAFAVDEAGFSIGHPPSIDEAFLEESERDLSVSPNFVTELQRVLQEQNIQQTFQQTTNSPTGSSKNTTSSKVTNKKLRSVSLPQFPSSSGEFSALSSRFADLIPRLFQSAADLQMPDYFLDSLEDCVSVVGEFLGQVLRQEIDLAAVSRVIGSLNEKVATAEQLSITSTDNHSAEARIWKRELDKLTSELSATRKLFEEASSKLAEAQRTIESLENAFRQKTDQNKLLTSQLKQSLAGILGLKKELDDYASMKENSRKLELEVLRLDAAFREMELLKADQELLIAKLSSENSELKLRKEQTAEELTRTRELAADANQLYHDRLKTVSAGFERQSGQLEQELQSTTDVLESFKSQTKKEFEELNEAHERLKKDLIDTTSNYEKLLIEERDRNLHLASTSTSFSHTIRNLQGEVRQYRQLLDVAEERTRRTGMVSAMDFAPVSEDVLTRVPFGEQFTVKQNPETIRDTGGDELFGS